MTSRVTVRRQSGTATDPETGLEGPGWVSVYADLPFRLGGSSSGDGGTRRVTIGGVEYQQATAVGHMPADTTDLRDGDLLEITSGEWSGSVFRIIEAVKGDQKTARRVPIVEVSRPGEWA